MAKKKDKQKHRVGTSQKGKGVNWDLVWKVLASVFAFAGSLATVYDLVGKIRSDAQTFYAFILPGLAIIVWLTVLIQLIRKKNPYVIPLLAVTIIGGVIGVIWQQSYNQTREDKVVVLVAKFDGPEETYGLQRKIIDDLQEATKDYDDTVIVEGNDLVTSSEHARELGSSEKADLVIWAWYRPTQDPNITIHIENLSASELTAIKESETYQPQATLSDLDFFTIQRQIGSETSTLITFLTAILKFNSGDYQTAIGRFEQIIEHEDVSTFINHYALYVYLGYSYSEIGNHEYAIRNYSEAIEINPKITTAYINRGNSYNDLSKYELAIHDLSKAIEIDPQNSAAYNNRGNSYNSLGNYELSIQDLDQAIKIDPEYVFAHSNRGLVYDSLKDYNRAIQDFDKAILLDPDFAGAYFNRGNAYYKIGEYELAIQNYDKTIELNPEYTKAYNNRGYSYDDLGNYELAIQDYEKVIELAPQDETGYNNRGAAYFSLGNYEFAIQDYDIAIMLNPQFANAYYNRGLAYFFLEEYERAVQDFSRSIELAPLYIDAYYRRGLAHQSIGNTAEAEADFKKYDEFTGQKP